MTANTQPARRRTLTGIHNTSRRRLAVGGAIAAITMLASHFVAPSQASAYDDRLAYSYMNVRTNTCEITASNDGRLATPYWRNGSCYGYDVIDGTWWVPDEGGLGSKWVLHHNGFGNWVGKIEWHPYGEHFWMYDLKNDGDTFYVTMSVPDAFWSRTFSISGSSDTVDIGHWNLNFPEGYYVYMTVYDNESRTDKITNRVFVGTT